MQAATRGTSSRLRHLIAADQFDRERLVALLDRADELEGVRDARLAGRIMATLFFEPSTRTRLSFESAMLRRGGSVIGSEAAATFSSAAKGESLDDTVRVVGAFADVLVVRHPQAGAVQRAAAVAPIPVINAGDGSGEHPTQAVLDLLCIRRERGAIEGTHIAFCGDLQYSRTVHSLARLLSRFPGVTMSFVAPPELQIDEATVGAVVGTGATIRRWETLDPIAGDIDVLYQTRIQRERAEGLPDGSVTVDVATMGRLSPGAIVMHPLPRVDEIDSAVDDDPRAAYFRQAAGGVAVRMAILEELVG